MNDKIKSYSWLPWAVALGLTVVIGWGITYLLSDWYSYIPWISAGEVSNANVFNESWNYETDVDLRRDKLIKSLVGLIVLFIIGPSLWIFSEIKNQYKKGEERLKKGISWYTGSILVIGSLLFFVYGAVMVPIANNNYYNSTQKTNYTINLRAQLYTIGFEALEQYYLPVDHGGAGGSFTSIPGKNGQTRTITLDDLSTDDSFTDTEFVIGPVESDSTLTIYGIGDQPGNDDEFKNANGQTGKLQFAIKVYPGAETVIFDHGNINPL